MLARSTLTKMPSAMELEKSMRVARCSKFACEGVLALRTVSATKGQLAFFCNNRERDWASKHEEITGRSLFRSVPKPCAQFLPLKPVRKNISADRATSPLSRKLSCLVTNQTPQKTMESTGSLSKQNNYDLTLINEKNAKQSGSDAK